MLIKNCAIFAVLAVIALLSTGCQQNAELKACQDEKAFLQRRIGEYKQVVDMKDQNIAELVETANDMGARYAEQAARIAILEKENEELRSKVGTPAAADEAKRLQDAAAQIRALQRQAAEKLKSQADANKPK